MRNGRRRAASKRWLERRIGGGTGASLHQILKSGGDPQPTPPQAPNESPPPLVPAGEPRFSRWGYGFQLDSEARRYLDGTCFGHDGAGGQVGFADVRHNIGFGFVTNWMMGPEDQRATAIIAALRASL